MFRLPFHVNQRPIINFLGDLQSRNNNYAYEARNAAKAFVSPMHPIRCEILLAEGTIRLKGVSSAHKAFHRKNISQHQSR